MSSEIGRFLGGEAVRMRDWAVTGTGTVLMER